MVQLHTQVVNMTNSMKVIYIVTLPEFSKTQIVTWECHVDEFAKCRYDMILIRDILITLCTCIEFTGVTMHSDHYNPSSLPCVHIITGINYQ